MKNVQSNEEVVFEQVFGDDPETVLLDTHPAVTKETKELEHKIEMNQKRIEHLLVQTEKFKRDELFLEIIDLIIYYHHSIS